MLRRFDRAIRGMSATAYWLTLAALVAAEIALAILVMSRVGLLSWYWTGNPSDIIGGNGLAIGDLHIWLHG